MGELLVGVGQALATDSLYVMSAEELCMTTSDLRKHHSVRFPCKLKRKKRRLCKEGLPTAPVNNSLCMVTKAGDSLRVYPQQMDRQHVVYPCDETSVSSKERQELAICCSKNTLGDRGGPLRGMSHSTPASSE